ncbi:MAG: class I SAM-dependent methyltransferase [Candidatus Korobacteraceae bacterium]
MTEWDAADYARISGLQQAMAAEALALLNLNGSERILDVGCGNGKITAEIAARDTQGSVVGVDPSHEMIEFASTHYGPALRPNLRFEVADARQLPYRNEFDLVVSFNALHWIPQQDEALRSIHSALTSGGRAQLRLVPKGKRESLENVLYETCLSPRWIAYYHDFHDPYLHLTPEEYTALAERCGFHVVRVHTEDKAWDFGSRSAFIAFGNVTFVEWTRYLPDDEKPAFIVDVLDRYRAVVADRPGQENTFKFYQMDITLHAGSRSEGDAGGINV